MDVPRPTDDARADRAGTVEAALEQVAARHGQMIFGFAIRLGLTSSEAEDCLQETLLRLWAELEAGRAIDDPKAWAFRTAYRIAMDEHRLRRRLGGLFARMRGRMPLEGEPGPERAAVDATIWPAVDRLPVRQRQVIYLRYRADLSFDQIGSILGITGGAARSHATFAVRTLREQLSADDDGAERE